MLVQAGAIARLAGSQLRAVPAVAEALYDTMARARRNPELAHVFTAPQCRLTQNITTRIAEAARRARETDRNPREVVDLAFDAFAHGAGQLASWMIITGNQDALDPVLDAIHRLVDDLGADHDHETGWTLQEETLQLVLTALGDALLGGPMAKALGLPRDKARALATDSLLAAHRLPLEQQG